MTTTSRQVAICQPNDAETFGNDNVTMRLLIDSADTGGSVSTLEVTMKAAPTAPPRTSTPNPMSSSTSPRANSNSWPATA